MRSFRGLAILVIPGAAVTLWIVWLPLPAELRQPLAGTAVLLDVRGREIADLPSPEARVQISIKLDEMGIWLPLIIVKLEDRRFYRHQGIDWQATGGACLRNLRSGKVVAGGSTITQQLIKLACKRQSRNWFAKLYEAILAWKLEQAWSKERILAEYLNRCSFGNRRLGPEAAAQAYFGKRARDLNLAESLYLAGLAQAPSRLNPWRHPDRAERKYTRTLEIMARTGVLSDAQQRLLGQTPPIPGHFNPPRLAPNYVDAIQKRWPTLSGRVRTTLNLDLQQIAESKLRAHLASLNRCDIADAAIIIIENSSGALRAMVGSANYDANQVNGALRPRSCGSILKPFVYLTAIDRRLVTAATLLPDTPDAIRDEYRDYEPQNFNRHYLGPVRVREALACSLNVPAVVTLSKVGARSAFYELQKWGFEFPRPFDAYGAGFVLGNAEIRLADLAAAYAGLARGGLAIKPAFLASEFHPVIRVASEAATTIITDILSDNEARKRSFGTGSPLAFEVRIAAKTGTSSSFRDAWTVGYDQEHTVAVWAGNSAGRPMHDTLAVRAAAPLWAAVMMELLRTDHPIAPPGANLVKRDICATTGFLPGRFSTEKIAELFLTGTAPTADCSGWFSERGKLCLPAEYAIWCASSDNIDGAAVLPEAKITNPRPGAIFKMDPVIPPKQQMIELLATLGSNVRWFIDGQPIEPQSNGRFFWQLTPGEWNLRATSPAGNAERTFKVE